MPLTSGNLHIYTASTVNGRDSRNYKKAAPKGKNAEQNAITNKAAYFPITLSHAAALLPAPACALIPCW
jgi:hypothetical protein